MFLLYIFNANESVLINCVLSSLAKLGDTKELEDFIADLDKTIASKCGVM